MKYLLLTGSFCLLTACASPAPERTDYPIIPVPSSRISLEDDFWKQRIQTNAQVTIPIALRHCETTGRIDYFRIAGGLLDGEFRSGSPFDDSDVFKIIEGAAYSLNTCPDSALQARIDSLIHDIALAQEPDGYLYTYRTIMGDDSHPWIGSRRWEFTHILSHELYNVGHLYEAAVAWYEATGKRNLLDVALKNADLVARDFGWDAFRSYLGHQEIELGLVKLYRTTGESKYLDLAKFFLDVRGTGEIRDSYNQSHKPVVEQDEAVGHSVRALYMYAAMADISALTGDESYTRAARRLWEDMAYTKLYITGGVGAAGGHEGFGGPYELPNITAYCETCAGIANVFWNQRMFLAEGDGQYIDVLERALYNNVLSGVAVTGDRFFYPNPLESLYGGWRSEWFGCACCPSNVSRFIPDVPGYIFAHDDRTIYTNLYISSSTAVDVADTRVALHLETGMPWSGETRLTVDPERTSRFALKLRVPGWARGQAAPDNRLYAFTADAATVPEIRVNGKPARSRIENGYVSLERKWRPGDRVTIVLPMDILRITADERVEGNRGKVALQRGPIVYCSEGVDFDEPNIMNLVLPDTAVLQADFTDDAPAAHVAITGRALRSSRDQDGEPRITGSCDFRAIPYYLWAHRGLTPMTTWYAGRLDAAKPSPSKTIASLSTLEGSVINASIKAIRDQILPAGSNDHNCAFFHWWPRQNTTEWLVYRFDKPYEISKSKVFWFSDGGGCKAPAGWRLYYEKDGRWEPVKPKNQYGIQLDIINTTDFEPVTTTAVRMEIDLPESCSSGIHEWIIE